MKRDDRLYDLVRLMRDGRLHTAAELAARLGVSPRTIWRDMAMLAATGMPVEGERGLGYILRAPLVLPPTLMTPDELRALSEGLRRVAADEADPLARPARSLLAKVATLLPQAEIGEG
ncbi:helix-turn-helix transcriptional regulator [Frigidibacter oleivorans]|uniref:helix-turn-helix transcriptional regulator n=1 Tax=Frigidibacter oleivorans TaxID=2487129 RepID=UPI000F8F0207|nr:HTH domain-containing protein [Frigidibacter oleivorans]